MTTHLTITVRGTLLSVLADTDITDSQASSILALLKAPDLTYGEVLKFLADRLQPSSWTETIYRTPEAALEATNREIDKIAHPDSEWARERREGLR